MKTFLIATTLILLSSCAFGFDFYYDGVFADNSSPFDFNNNTAPINYPTGAGLPSPGTQGEGGEGFDLEGLRVAENGDYIYIALANSFGWAAHSTTYNQDFWMGDLFIGIDGADYSLAIDIQELTYGASGSTRMYDVSGGNWNGIPSILGGYGNDSYPYASIVDAVGAFDKGDNSQANMSSEIDVYLGMIEGYEEDFGALASDGGDTYVWEFRLHRSLIGDFKNLEFHASLACGNDVLEGSYTATAIPEPATALLFALGMAGVAAYRRRRN